MSLSTLDTQQNADLGVPVEILNPKTGLPIGLRITVLGTDSDTYQEIVNRQTNKRLAAAKKNRGQLPTLTVEQIEGEQLNVLVGCTQSWESYDPAAPATAPVPTVELTPGVFLDCTPENVRTIYAHRGFSWLRRQVDDAIGDQTLFLTS